MPFSRGKVAALKKSLLIPYRKSEKWAKVQYQKNCISLIRHFGGRNFAGIRQGATPTPNTLRLQVVVIYYFSTKFVNDCLDMQTI